MSLRELLVTHLPPWLLPVSPWEPKGRPEMTEKHTIVNKQQALSLRIDRLSQRDRLRAQARLEEWREQRRE